MKPINEEIIRKQIFSTHSPPSEEIVFIHSLLNYHLGPPEDQLPMEGPGARNFGPRTKAKVQRFQEVNNIDIGTPSFRDGIVGPHTWDKLLEKQQLTTTIIVTPAPVLPPLKVPGVLPGLPLPPAPIIPVPRLTLDSVQVQYGGQVTVPFNSGDKSILSYVLQVVFVVLNKNNKQKPHLEGQFGAQVAANQFLDSPFDPFPKDNSRFDAAVTATLFGNNLPGSGTRFVWGVGAQGALIKSVSGPQFSGQGTLLIQPSVNLDKDGTWQVTGQAGLLGTVEVPNRFHNGVWKLSGGAAFSLSITANF